MKFLRVLFIWSEPVILPRVEYRGFNDPEWPRKKLLKCKIGLWLGLSDSVSVSVVCLSDCSMTVRSSSNNYYDFSPFPNPQTHTHRQFTHTARLSLRYRVRQKQTHRHRHTFKQTLTDTLNQTKTETHTQKQKNSLTVNSHGDSSDSPFSSPFSIQISFLFIYFLSDTCCKKTLKWCDMLPVTRKIFEIWEGAEIFSKIRYWKILCVCVWCVGNWV